MVLRMKDELKNFNIDLDDIKETDEFYTNVHKAINKMQNEYMAKNIEVVLNENLIECKNKLDGCKVIFGAKISFVELEKDISFIVREYIPEPDYKKLYFELNDKLS